MAFKSTLFQISATREIEAVETAAGTTYVRSMTVGEKDAMELAAQKDGNLRAHFLIACCCDAGGRPEFDVFDIGKINTLPVRVIEPIIDAAQRVNKVSSDEMEAIRKNSATTPGGNSSSP